MFRNLGCGVFAFLGVTLAFVVRWLFSGGVLKIAARVFFLWIVWHMFVRSFQYILGLV